MDTPTCLRKCNKRGKKDEYASWSAEKERYRRSVTVWKPLTIIEAMFEAVGRGPTRVDAWSDGRRMFLNLPGAGALGLAIYRRGAVPSVVRERRGGRSRASVNCVTENAAERKPSKWFAAVIPLRNPRKRSRTGQRKDRWPTVPTRFLTRFPTLPRPRRNFKRISVLFVHIPPVIQYASYPTLTS